MKKKLVFSWLLRVTAAVIMLQTLYFKFTAEPESIYIFSKVGIEPWGRIATGIAELIASILLLVPATISIGAIMAIGIMTGAIITHLTILGVEVQGDGGQLFYYALTVFVFSLILVFMHYRQLFMFKKLLLK
ncbi:MAG: DoxX family protein [Chitinophagaceae bacterium]